MTVAPSAWQPDRGGIEQLVKLLNDSQTPTDALQRQVQRQLESFNAIPDFNKYLTYILVHMTAQPEAVRAAAGLCLKNNIREHFSEMLPDVHDYIKSEICKAIGDPSQFVRNTVGTVLSTIVTQVGVEGWPNLLQSLAQCLESTDYNVVEGAFDALYKICEDSGEKLDSDALGRPLDYLIPKFIQFFQAPQEPLRKYSLGCVNQFVLLMPHGLSSSMDRYLQGLFQLANDPSANVRVRICQALVMLLQIRPECLMPHIAGVIEYMLHSSQDDDDIVALEACEFWSAFADTKACRDVLPVFLPRLIPVLLKGMVYSEEDIAVLGTDEEDESVPDRPEDIKPIFYHPKSQGGNRTHDHQEGDDEDADDDEEDEDDFDDDNEVSEWNLRKCSAAGLDVLSGVFGDDLLPILLPLIQERLSPSQEWPVRESGILALGAVAEGCYNGMRQHLPQLIPYLTAQLQDPRPLLRSITCWTLSRFSRWVVQQNDHEHYLRPLMQELLKCILDRNKKVQEAACSAFATLEEEAQSELVPYLGPILQNLMFAFQKYQAKNLLILYDAIGTLADAVSHELGRPEYVAVLMPPLIKKWNELPDNDKNLFPLLECLTSVAQALSLNFREFAEPVYQRCIKLIEQTLRAQATNGGEDSEKEFIVCALDLLSGLAEGLKADLEPLIGRSNLAPLLFECCKDRAPDVRQSAYALVGDLAKNCVLHLRPCIHQYLPVLTENLDPDFISVCNNASWAIGEIAVKVGEEMRPFMTDILNRLIPLMNKVNLNKSLLENTAITLGRLAMVCPADVAPRLALFIQPWCVSLRAIRDDIEKEHAFIGLCKMVRLNPHAVLNVFVYLCDAICSWYDPKPELKEMFREILHGFKNSLGAEQWKLYLDEFPPQLKSALVSRYQV